MVVYAMRDPKLIPLKRPRQPGGTGDLADPTLRSERARIPNLDATRRPPATPPPTSPPDSSPTEQ
ncbi:MAG: hypothetical protein JST54_21840 [Deltaproteobacteria bacterium]|nr:hypothetical protein [Deltaproteobacteria bacterium]